MTSPLDGAEGDIDDALDSALDGLLLQVPDGFAERVMAALPARPAQVPPWRAATRGWRVVQALVLTACGALGAIEVLLFVGGLWTATAVAIG